MPVPRENLPQPTLPAGRLERWLDRPRREWTVDDLARLFEQRSFRLLSLMHIGGDGWLKTLDFAPRSADDLRRVLASGERADGSSIFAGLGIPTEASDILLRPRPASAFADPFSPHPTLVLLCSHSGRDGEPLPESPDTILRRAAGKLREELDIELHALGEVEYFLAKRREESDIYGADDRGYHATSPFVFGEGLRREALAILSEIGVAVKYGHSEVGYIEAERADERIWEQHEIELSLAPLAEAAEAVALAQWVLRNLAHRRGMLCTFDPILRKGHAGSGLHFHFSPVRGGHHLGGRDGGGELHPPARWLIAGLVRHGGALMAFGNRDEGSFVRLSQGKEAPSVVRWGASDRKALIRLPIVARDEGGRPLTPPTIEFRLPDGSAHPHLLLAGVAQALRESSRMEGIDELLARTASDASAGEGREAQRVPSTFSDVAACLRSRREVFERDGVFPSGLIDKLLASLLAPRRNFDW